MKQQLVLFNLPENSVDSLKEKPMGTPRLRIASREQYEFKSCLLNDLIPKEHLARDIWDYVNKLDLSISLSKIQSVEGKQGSPAIDPKILVCLWLFATIKGISSSRAIEELTKEHNAFIWICGGVNVNYHTISDYRSKSGDQLDNLLTQSIAVLSHTDVISLERVSQDGIRVRAHAGRNSFRREGSLNDHLILAKELVNDLKEEEQKNPGSCKTRLKAAQKRVTKEKAQRIEEALNELKELQEERMHVKNKKHYKDSIEKARASTTDPQARIMKVANGGYNPAYNIQYATTNKGKAIVGVNVIKKGTDNNQIITMIEEMKKRCGVIPKKWLVDTGYESFEELEKISKKFPECKVYIPGRERKGKDPYKLNPRDSLAIRDWKKRMASKEGKKIYNERPETAELINAQARNRGLQQVLVRGLKKVKDTAVIFAIAHNMMIAIVKLAGSL